MIDPVQPPLYKHEAVVVARAMEWADRMWPFDPAYADHDDNRPFWPEMDGEIAIPQRLEVRHFDGYRIGWLENRDNQIVFIRDYHQARGNHEYSA